MNSSDYEIPDSLDFVKKYLEGLENNPERSERTFRFTFTPPPPPEPPEKPTEPDGRSSGGFGYNMEGQKYAKDLDAWNQKYGGQDYKTKPTDERTGYIPIQYLSDKFGF